MKGRVPKSDTTRSCLKIGVCTKKFNKYYSECKGDDRYEKEGIKGLIIIGGDQ
jgi:hypothetical protein